jgi:precorrin isomerase
VQEFLVAVDRLMTLEHESDEAERRAEAEMLTSAGDFRVLHLLSLIASGLEESVDALARCALMLKDAVMSEMLVE